MQCVEERRSIKRQSIIQRYGTYRSSPTNRRSTLKSQTFAFSAFDMDEMERTEPRELFLCVQLCNNDNVIIKIGKKTTAKQVLARLRGYSEVKKLHPKNQELELVLSVCLTLGIQSRSLPNYFQVHRLHDMGFWTRPFEYAHCPLLTLKTASLQGESDFTLPEVLQCTMDQLVHGGKAPNWSSNSREATAFRLKYPLNDVWEPRDTHNRYPEFVDSHPDATLDFRSHVVNIRLSGLTLTETSLVITHTTTLRDALYKLQEKVKKLVDVVLDVEHLMLKVVGVCEYIWNWDVPVLQTDGVREALHTHQTPWLQLVERPSFLQFTGRLPSFAVYDVVVPLVSEAIAAVLDNLDISYFPENDLSLDDDEELNRVNHVRWTVIEKRSSIVTIAQPIDQRPKKARAQTMLSGSQARRRRTSELCFSEMKDTHEETEAYIDVRKLHTHFRMKVLGIENLHMYRIDEETGERAERLPIDRVRVEVSLYTGAVRLETCKFTPFANCARGTGKFIETVRWNEWVTFRVFYSQLPLAAMLKFRVLASSTKTARESTQDLGWVNFRIFDFTNRMETGLHRVGIYPYYSVQDSTGSTSVNTDPTASQLFIQMDSFLQPVVFASSSDATFDMEGFLKEQSMLIPPQDKKEIERLIEEDPLYELQENEKVLLWKYRAYVAQTRGLPKLLESVDWCSPACVRDLHFLLQLCPVHSPLVGLELLDGKFADCKVRDYAVKCLSRMTNFECRLYLLQLVQALKFEPYHDSALARFLMKRALKHPSTIGHTFFWLLRSEIEDPFYQERFGLLLEQFVRKCGPVHDSLVFEDYLIRHLEGLAKTITKYKDGDSAEALAHFLQEELASFNDEMPENYPLAFNPKMRVKKIKPEECKVMMSKKRPLYLVFENLEEDGDVHVLFKTGDDLRQDLAVIKMMKIMQNLWAEAGLDLKLSLYHCMPLASGTGMLEIVQNSKTLAAVYQWGGGQLGVLSKKTLALWLQENSTADNPVENFIRSCAGYSVGMYVLGVADRHSDNLMVKYSGHIFHIDFGHFLGYFKKKMGFKRETAPFVFTSDFQYVMGGKHSKGYQEFKDLCVKAYNVLRRSRRLFITLLCLMLCSGIPEITRHDIGYLLRTLPGSMTDEDAGVSFLSALKQALESKMTRINFWMHQIVHY